MGTTGSLVTQTTVGLSSDFTLLFCVYSSSKQPHNILQKRLMETNLSKFRGSRGSWTPKGDLSAQTNRLNQTKLGSSGKTEDEELIVVSCQVILPPQPFVGFFLLQILFLTVSGCALAVHVFQPALCSHGTVPAVRIHSLCSSRLLWQRCPPGNQRENLSDGHLPLHIRAEGTAKLGQHAEMLGCNYPRQIPVLTACLFTSSGIPIFFVQG